MNNLFSNLLADTTAQGRAAFRIALVVIVAVLSSVPFYFYAATQANAWQIYAIVASLVVLCIMATISAVLARRNRIYLSVSLIIGSAYFVIPFITALISGVGLALSITLFLVVAVIVGQTLSGVAATRALLGSIVIAVITLLGDLYAPWNRLSIPVLQTVIPFIAAGVVLALGILSVRQFSNFSLRTKLIVTSIGIAFISAGATVFITNFAVRAELIQQVGGTILQLADGNASEIGQALASNVRLLEGVTLNKLVQDAVELSSQNNTNDLNQIEALDQQWREADETASDDHPLVSQVLNNEIAIELREFRGRFPDQAEVFVTDKFGVNVAATNRTSDYYQADEAWWQAAYNNGQGGVFIGEPELDVSSQTYGVIIALPIPSHNGTEIVGVLRTTLRFETLLNILEDAKFQETGEVQLLLPENRLISEASETGLLPLDPNEIEDIHASKGTFNSIIYQGKPSLVSESLVTAHSQSDRAIIEALGWHIIVSQAQAEALLPVTSVTRTNILVSLAVLLIAVAFAYFIAQLISSPILQLTAAAEQVRAGNLNVETEIRSTDEIGLLATTFNGMTAQIRGLVGTLEQRISDRTRALATSTEVSRRLSTILNQDELVREVVTQIQKAFDYYHVHIYLWDEKHENLVMAGGTGEAGRIMLASGHSIPAERGLVGRAAETGTVVLVSDVTQTIGWLPNPLLPDTKAEIAIPILLGDAVLGVLDVQHHTVGGLDQNDSDLLQAIANQVAIALQNARAYTDSQKQVAREASQNDIVQKIRNTATIEDALKVTIRELGRAVGQKTAIRLGNGSNDSVKEA